MSPALATAASAAAPLAALLRDIHPGPALLPTAPDPRIAGWIWLFAILCALLLLGTALSACWRYWRWTRQVDWAAPDLVPQLQGVLRQAALARWPEARNLQGDAWLAFLDGKCSNNKGGPRFSDFSDAWPGWLYGQDEPAPLARAQLRRAYQRWGRTCICPPWAGLTLRGLTQRELTWTGLARAIPWPRILRRQGRGSTP